MVFCALSVASTLPLTFRSAHEPTTSKSTGSPVLVAAAHRSPTASRASERGTAYTSPRRMSYGLLPIVPTTHTQRHTRAR